MRGCYAVPGVSVWVFVGAGKVTGHGPAISFHTPGLATVSQRDIGGQVSCEELDPMVHLTPWVATQVLSGVL
jgi:hypothetical protein